MESLVAWGESIKLHDWPPFYPEIEQLNPWFTGESVSLALKGIAKYLEPGSLHHWQSSYQKRISSAKTVGIIMAGNIPVVGFHDLVCCYLTGHRALIKPSSQDELLIKLLVDLLFEIDPVATDSLRFVSQLHANDVDAIIATGSDNSTRYFEYHFQQLPALIRSNRTSLAVISGDEPDIQLQLLGHDIYSYFGRGCRNVSKVMFPEGFDIGQFNEILQPYGRILENTRYSDNYRYQKALHQIQNLPHIDTGFSLLAPSTSIVAPLSVLYYDNYQNQDQLDQVILTNRHKIQCIASDRGWYQDSHSFGTLQFPEPWDYADGVDTVAFLLGL